MVYIYYYPQYGLISKIKYNEKILLSAIYPFWFFFGKTWFGNVMMILIVLMFIPILISVMFPDLMNTTGEGAESIGIGVGILSLICSPSIGLLFMMLADRLEPNYEKWNYKTEMKTKMI